LVVGAVVDEPFVVVVALLPPRVPKLIGAVPCVAPKVVVVEEPKATGAEVVVLGVPKLATDVVVPAVKDTPLLGNAPLVVKVEVADVPAEKPPKTGGEGLLAF